MGVDPVQAAVLSIVKQLNRCDLRAATDNCLIAAIGKALGDEGQPGVPLSATLLCDWLVPVDGAATAGGIAVLGRIDPHWDRSMLMKMIGRISAHRLVLGVVLVVRGNRMLPIRVNDKPVAVVTADLFSRPGGRGGLSRSQANAASFGLSRRQADAAVLPGKGNRRG